MKWQGISSKALDLRHGTSKGLSCNWDIFVDIWHNLLEKNV